MHMKIGRVINLYGRIGTFHILILEFIYVLRDKNFNLLIIEIIKISLITLVCRLVYRLKKLKSLVEFCIYLLSHIAV